MNQITAKFGILVKNDEHHLFENGTVCIFQNECEVLSFETEAEREQYIKDNEICLSSSQSQQL